MLISEVMTHAVVSADPEGAAGGHAMSPATSGCEAKGAIPEFFFHWRGG